MNLVSISKIAKNVDWESKLNETQQAEQMKLMGKQILESILNGIVNNKNCTMKEVKTRLKYIDENPEQFFTTLYSYIPPDTFKKAR